MIDLALILVLMAIIGIAAVTHLRGWARFDLSKPLPTPPSANWSLLGLAVTVVLVLRWFVDRENVVTLFFGVMAAASMTWCWRIAVRAEARHADYLRRRGEQPGGGLGSPPGC